ncbi:AraC family transcriptional regulator [Gemmatimonadetes bacterium T265]|nr:AraC family transcriptional regulator [Gemmatimonadetes bacterium T265]
MTVGCQLARMLPALARGSFARAYTEVRPPAPLASVVSALWSHERVGNGPAARPRRILPDGSTDVVLGFTPVGPAAVGGVPAPLALAEAWVVGTMTTAHVVGTAAPTAYVGVRLRPEVAGRVFGVAAADLADGRVPLDALWPNAEEFLAPLARVPDLDGARSGVAAALAVRLAPLAPPPAAVTRAVRLFEASGGRARVAAVGRALGVSRQHLARQFVRHVGLAPKPFARVARLRALHVGLRALERRDAEVCWGALAYAHGYADQAHLIEEVRALVGLTPSAWARERRTAEVVPFAQDGAAADA